MREIAGRTVYPVGMGVLPLSDPVLAGQAERAAATIHAALDAGITFFDTADAYAPDWSSFGHNETLLGQALRSWGAGGIPPEVVVATKGGLTRGPGETWGRDARPSALLRAAEASAVRLGVAQLDLYFLHRLDPAVAFDEQVRGLAAVRDRGIAGAVGLSNVDAAQLGRALDLIGGPGSGVAAVQNEYSPAYREGSDVLEICRAHGIAFIPWSPFGGVSRGERSPRFAVFSRIAADHGVSPQQVVLAWLLHLGRRVIPIPGASRPQTIADSARAAQLRLSSEELSACSATRPTGRSVFPDDTPPPPM